MKNEATRVRSQGTKVTRSETPEQKIAALREIVASGQYAKIDGVMVDLFSASAIVRVYDGVNETNRIKYAGLPVAKMANIAFQLLK